MRRKTFTGICERFNARSVQKFKRHMESESLVRIDREAVADANSIYIVQTSKHLRNLISMQSETIAHLILSLGSDFCYSDSRYPLLMVRTCDLIKSQTYATEGKAVFRTTSELAWEIIAYSLLSGVSQDEPIFDDLTLRELAQNSRNIRLSSNSLSYASKALLASAIIFADDAASQILSIENVPIRLPQLAKLILLEQSRLTEQKGCIEIHALEALCFSAFKLPKMQNLRNSIEMLVTRKLELLYEIGAKLNLFYPSNSVAPSLQLSSFNENFSSQISHILELGALAIYCGFELSPSHINALHSIVNTSARLFAYDMKTFEVFDYSFSHFRRAASLLLEYETLSYASPPQYGKIDLSSYSVSMGSNRLVA